MNVCCPTLLLHGCCCCCCYCCCTGVAAVADAATTLMPIASVSVAPSRVVVWLAMRGYTFNHCNHIRPQSPPTHPPPPPTPTPPATTPTTSSTQDRVNHDATNCNTVRATCDTGTWTGALLPWPLHCPRRYRVQHMAALLLLLVVAVAM